jgi:hypothetical protein
MYFILHQLYFVEWTNLNSWTLVLENLTVLEITWTVSYELNAKHVVLVHLIISDYLAVDYFSDMIFRTKYLNTPQ